MYQCTLVCLEDIMLSTILVHKLFSQNRVFQVFLCPVLLLLFFFVFHKVVQLLARTSLGLSVCILCSIFSFYGLFLIYTLDASYQRASGTRFTSTFSYGTQVTEHRAVIKFFFSCNFLIKKHFINSCEQVILIFSAKMFWSNSNNLKRKKFS